MRKSRTIAVGHDKEQLFLMALMDLLAKNVRRSDKGQDG